MAAATIDRKRKKEAEVAGMWARRGEEEEEEDGACDDDEIVVIRDQRI